MNIINDIKRYIEFWENEEYDDYLYAKINVYFNRRRVWMFSENLFRRPMKCLLVIIDELLLLVVVMSILVEVLLLFISMFLFIYETIYKVK